MLFGAVSHVVGKVVAGILCIEAANQPEMTEVGRWKLVDTQGDDVELCYFKLDLAKTRVYSLETGFFIDKKENIR